MEEEKRRQLSKNYRRKLHRKIKLIEEGKNDRKFKNKKSELAGFKNILN